MSEYPFLIKEHVLPCQHIRGYPRATAHEQEELLHMAIKQYTPRDNQNPKPGDVTIIGAHANGFPKELYEPLWEEILNRAKAAGFSIRNIWIADVSHQGASGVLNEHKLGNDPSWFDHPRDLLHMVNHFRDQMVRPIVGVGHSMGGNNLVNLALMHPRLLETLVLIDPVIAAHASRRGNQLPALSSARRRDVWPSRAAAAAALKNNKFYQTWDARVLDLWIQHGLRDLPTALYPDPASPDTPAGGVTLATTKHQEVMTFLRPNFDALADPAAEPALDNGANRRTHPDYHPATAVPDSPFYRAEAIITFELLPHLRPSVLYVFGETSDLSAPELRADKLRVTGAGIGGSGGARDGRVREHTVPGVGHLIPMEAVGATADLAADWLGEELARWREDEAAERAQWARVPDAQKRVLSPLYLKMLNRAREQGNGNGNGNGNGPRDQKL